MMYVSVYYVSVCAHVCASLCVVCTCKQYYYFISVFMLCTVYIIELYTVTQHQWLDCVQYCISSVILYTVTQHQWLDCVQYCISSVVLYTVTQHQWLDCVQYCISSVILYTVTQHQLLDTFT